MVDRIDNSAKDITNAIKFSNTLVDSAKPDFLHMQEGGLRAQGIVKEIRSELPLITIITVVYNGIKYIEGCIKSVIEQSYSNIDYIIIDGGSNDGTIDVLKKYDNEIGYWLSEPDHGIYDAMNKAIALASPGSWVLIIGADDKLIDTDCIVGAIHRFSDARNLLFDVERHDVKSNKKIKYLCRIPDKDNDFLRFPLHHQGFVFKKDDELNFDVNLGVHADLYFMYSRIHRGDIVKIDEVISSYLTGGASSYIYLSNARSIYSVAKRLQSEYYPEIINRNFFGFIKIFTKALVRSFLKRLGF